MKTLGSLILAFSIVGCGGEAITDSEPGPGTGGVTATGGSSGGSPGSGGATMAGAGGGSAGTPSGGSAGVGGSAGSGTGGGSGEECVEQPGVGMWPPLEASCQDLWVLDVANPKVVDESGNGVITPGETVDIHVELKEIAGYGWGMYPGVDFTSDHPGVSVKWNDWYYAIFACQTHPASATVVVAGDVTPGSVVTITARVAMLDTVCPAANAIQIPLLIE